MTSETTAPTTVPSTDLPLTSQHTSSFAEILDQLGISIAVRTYQAGKLVLLRAIDLLTGQTVAWLKFGQGVQEIFAINVLANSRCPDVINDNHKLIADSFVLPDESLSSVPDDLRVVAT